MVTNPLEILGQNIRQERVSQNMTQEQLSEKADISAVFLSQIENGRKTPSLETVINITGCLGITMENAFKEKYSSVPHIDMQIETLLKGKTENERKFLLDIMNYISRKIDRHLK